MIKDIISQLQQHKNALQAQIDKIDSALGSLDSITPSVGGAGSSGMPSLLAKAPKGKGGMSASARAAIGAAQKARWARYHAAQGKAPVAAKKPKSGMSPLRLARLRLGQAKRRGQRAKINALTTEIARLE